MRLFLNVFFMVLMVTFTQSCSNNEPQNEAVENEEASTVNVEVGGEDNPTTLVQGQTPDIEAQRNPQTIAEAKKAALAKANANSDNSHFKEIAPKEVKEKMVDEAATTTDKVDGQNYELVEGAKVKHVKKTRKYTPEELAAPLIGTNQGQVKTKDGRVVSATPKSADNVESQKDKTKSTIHDIWNEILKDNVAANGRVNYKKIKGQKTKLDDYLNTLKQNPPQSGWSKAKTMAYWINAYNAFTIKLIVDNMPINSIMDLDGGKVWDRKWIKIGGRTYSLNNIENDILRAKYKEPRIHFVVNCAAISCPPLWNRAWTEENLFPQMERRTKIFIDNNKFNRVFEENIYISKIFDWYKEDFGNIITYLNKYTSEHIATNAKINYLDYDWALNEQ